MIKVYAVLLFVLIVGIVYLLLATHQSESKESSIIVPIPSESFHQVFLDSSPIVIPEPTASISFVPKQKIEDIVGPAPKPKSKITFVPSGTLSITEGKRLAKAYVRSRVSSASYSCLIDLWNKESGWNYLDLNTSSGAYGIPQALPGSKMASAGSDWRTNPITQVKWGLGYINGRYGSACGAWKFWLSHKWY